MQFNAFAYRPGGGSKCRISLGIVVTALLVGGCATGQDDRSGVAGPQYVARAQAPAKLAAKVEVEADGLPSQLAPRHRRPEPDDPSEPWSPNYGTSARTIADRPPSAATGNLDTSRIAAKIELAREAAPPAIFSRPMPEDDIIRRAIAEHEMRRN